VTAHLTDAELRAFASGSLTPDGLLRADDHLSECERCRTAAATVNDVSARIGDLRAQLNDPTAMHVSEEELVLLVQDRLPAGGRDAILHHLKECSTCAAHADELRRWTASPVARTNWSRLALAAAVLLAVLLPATIWLLRGGGRAATPSSLAGLDTLPTGDQTRVRAALNAGVASLPTFVNEIASTRETLMGSSATREGTFALISPLGTGTVSDRPLFRWQAVDRADGYEVAVFDERSNTVARSPTVTTTEWSPTDPLARDRTYVWQVAAHRIPETITAPTPPASPARFHVIDGRSAELLRQLEAQYPQSHVLLGLLYLESGVVDAAAAHLRQVPPTDPHAALASRSLEKLATLDAARMLR
jgi:hypothetical protein